MTQNRALQLLYDLRYLSIVLTAKGEEVKSSRSKQDSRYRHPLGSPSAASFFPVQIALFRGGTTQLASYCALVVFALISQSS